MNTDLLQTILRLSRSRAAWATTLRRQMHRGPEPAFKEHRTSGCIAEALASLGLTVRTGVAGTGLLVDINSEQPGRYVILRADMDALAIPEATGAEYASENPGYSHSCGHDGHCAALAAAGAILLELRNAWRGRIRLLFQPAEETAEGARSMIAAGALDPRPDAILSLHAWPGLNTGAVACRNGTMLASCDVMHIHIRGKGGHGARPDLANNPLIGATRVVDRLSGLDGAERVVSMCMARVGEQANVIADSGQLSGTVRALTPAFRDRTLHEIQTIVGRTCNELGMTGEVVSMRRYLERLFEMVEARCEQLGSSEYLAMARRMMKEGPESQWQVRRCEELGGYLRALELDIAARTVV